MIGATSQEELDLRCVRACVRGCLFHDLIDRSRGEVTCCFFTLHVGVGSGGWLAERLHLSLELLSFDKTKNIGKPPQAKAPPCNWSQKKAGWQSRRKTGRVEQGSKSLIYGSLHCQPQGSMRFFTTRQSVYSVPAPTASLRGQV